MISKTSKEFSFGYYLAQMIQQKYEYLNSQKHFASVIWGKTKISFPST